MANMSFDTFTWPKNPEQYEEHYRREPVYVTNAAGKLEFSGMSPVKRTIVGKGAFCGANAYASFKTLSALIGQTSPKTLTHPVWGSCKAYLTELTSNQQARDDYVAYSFTFQAADGSGAIPK